MVKKLNVLQQLKKKTKFCSKKNLCDCYFDFALKC